MIPCLFSWPEQYGQHLVFALAGDGQVLPVRLLAINKVRWLGSPKPAPLPSGFVVHVKGQACIDLLDECGLWEGLLHLMAQDMFTATKRNPRAGSKAEAELSVHLTEIGKWERS